MTLTVEALLAGPALTHEVDVPPELLRGGGEPIGGSVLLRPLTVSDLQSIAHASDRDASLSAAFIIRHGLVEPELSLEEIASLPAGLARFLVQQVNGVSGIDTPRGALQELVQAPLARACFILAREFGWTPEEVSGLTIGQILVYLEMATESRNGA